MKTDGFIYLHRKILNNPYLNDKPFCRGFAWNVLLLLTNRKVGYIEVKNGQKIKLMRGDCGYSQKALADIFGWSRGKVKRFLIELEKRKMIQQKIVANHTVIKVLKFNIYQNRQQTDIEIEQQKIAKIEQQKIAQKSDYVYISKSELEKMIQQKIAKTDTKTDTNNNNIDIYSNNIISSSSLEEILNKISKEEEEELKKIAKENKKNYFRPWLRKIIDHGDIQELLQKAKARIERRKQKESAATAKIEEIQEPKELTEQGHSKAKAAFEKLKQIRR